MGEENKGSIIGLFGSEVIFIKLLAQGLSTKEIAVALRRPKTTVDKWRWQLIHKYNAKNAVHLVAMCYENGILIPLTKCCNPKPFKYEFINSHNLNN